jgi:hypothetical protein
MVLPKGFRSYRLDGESREEKRESEYVGEIAVGAVD